MIKFTKVVLSITGIICIILSIVNINDNTLWFQWLALGILFEIWNNTFEN